MKRLWVWIIAAISCFVFTSSHTVLAQADTTVVSWMHENGLTKFDNKEDFWRERPVTRGEIAKFFTQFAVLYGKEKVKTSTECQFNDIDGYDYTLVPHIIEACEYGLMKWSNGSYFPNKNLTLAEWLTVIIRTIDGMQDETGNPWWTETHNTAEWLWILDGESVWDLDKAATRWKIGQWLYRANTAPVELITKEGSDKVKELMTEIFGQDFWSDL